MFGQGSLPFLVALDQPGPQVNKLAVLLGGETVNKFPQLTTPSPTESFHLTLRKTVLGLVYEPAVSVTRRPFAGGVVSGILTLT